MTELKNRIQQLSTEYFEDIRVIRRHFHRHPELSKKEFETAAYICSCLDKYGIPYRNNIAGTGIVGLISGSGEGKNIVLRADMDALPVNEANDTEYKSEVPGTMHACGHDVHMSCLLGAARILNTLKDRFHGSVKIIFQPSEESYPGGAIGMIRNGVLKNPDTSIAIAQHVLNTIDAGKIGIRPGFYMASTDEIYLTVKGKSGHAATPEQDIDPVLIAAHILVAIQQIVSRNASPLMPTVISFGKIIGEGRTNIIPAEVKIEGTVRTFSETWRKEIHEKIRKIASGIAEALGGECDVFVDPGYPAVKNDETVTRNVRAWATEYLGEKNVIDVEQRMTAEDFSYFSWEIPSCLYRLGIRNEKKGFVSNLHTPTFDVDESSLVTGMGLMAYLAVRALSE
ncbi:MAG: M20 family metallopeptidase [Bacteroidota bacterium]|nr:M20 family metallopeptidase [Bacteroidota bacterium]